MTAVYPAGPPVVITPGQAFICTNDDILEGNPMSIPIASPAFLKAKHKLPRKTGPAPKQLVTSIRKELKRLMDSPEFENNLTSISRFAAQADELLMHVRAPEQVMRRSGIGMANPNVGDEYGPMMGAETYGATFIRELLPALKGIAQAQKETPESLTFAIAVARREGMTDLAAELEQKLVGKRLDGARPVDGKAPTVASYLEGTTPTMPNKKKGKKKTQLQLRDMNGTHGDRVMATGRVLP